MRSLPRPSRKVCLLFEAGHQQASQTGQTGDSHKNPVGLLLGRKEVPHQPLQDLVLPSLVEMPVLDDLLVDLVADRGGRLVLIFRVVVVVVVPSLPLRWRLSL